ncbi:MAG: aminotransferase class V-fold PLP-dependent enzyme [Candidatus Rokuibacteriota bacterium]
MTPIYLDHNATTPLDPQVIDVMQPFLREHFGNPSSAHAYGRAAREAVEQARAQVAALLGAEPSEIVFTGGRQRGEQPGRQGRVLQGAGEVGGG